jgi:hypothetical protein
MAKSFLQARPGLPASMIIGRIGNRISRWRIAMNIYGQKLSAGAARAPRFDNYRQDRQSH